jgi:hypothetical protein
MVDKGWRSLSLIGVETPAVLFPLLNRSTQLTISIEFVFSPINICVSYFQTAKREFTGDS